MQNGNFNRNQAGENARQNPQQSGALQHLASQYAIRGMVASPIMERLRQIHEKNLEGNKKLTRLNSEGNEQEGETPPISASHYL